MRPRAPLSLLLALVAGVAAVPAAAAAAQPTCGQVVTASVRLQADLVCPATSGLVVGADGVTIDLAGHAILSVDTDEGPVGVDNSGGYDRVTIRDGRIGLFERQIVMTGARRNRIVDVDTFSSRNGPLIAITGGAQNTVTGGSADDGDEGIVVRGSDRVRITGVTADGGINGPGIFVIADRATIARNVVDEAVGSSLLVHGSHNRVVRNVVFGGDLAAITIGEGARTVVADNVAVGGGSEFGIDVGTLATRTVVRGNVSVGHVDDGIRVQDPTAVLVRNFAADNGDLGIDAVPGVTGRANVARRNGNPLQCVGVPCAP